MRIVHLAGLALAATSIAASVSAQQAVNGMNIVACPKAVGDIATCYSAKIDTGAYLLAAMPKNWNGDLIVYAHGGPSVTPYTAKSNDGSLENYAVGVKLGYAWIASSYRKEGYGGKMAAADVDDARRFFLARFPKPKHTLLHGSSYGGLIGAKLLELYVSKNPDGSMTYDGAFFNSGVVGGAYANYEFRTDLRAVYQYYCKNLPRAGEAQYPLWMGLASDSKLTQGDINARIDECTGVGKSAAERTEAQKRNLANILAVMRIPQNMLARHMQAATFVFRDVAERITEGQSAFSNRNVKYSGSSDDAALNAGVARFDADEGAVAALKDDGVAAGKIPVPVVSIHSLNDPQAAVESQYEYRERAKAQGRDGLLVQAYTDENVHVGQSDAEMAASLTALAAWIDKKEKPSPQSIAAACEKLKATFEGPCRWHTDYQPKPLATRFARGAAN